MSIALSTSDPAQHAEQLRREMRSIRRELGQDVEELVENAEQLLDWRYHVRRYPWVSVGVAALAGYLLVPSRSVVFATDSHSLNQLAERIAPAVTKPEPQRPGLLASLISVGTGLLLKAATGYATQRLGQIVGQMNQASAPPQTAETHHG